MVKFMEDFLSAMANEGIGTLQEICADLVRTTFHFENLFGPFFPEGATANAYYGMSLFLTGLLTLKLLWKGWNTYILWQGGDPENAPGELLKGAVWAEVVAVGFPLAYDIGTEVVLEIVDTVLGYFNLSVSLGDTWTEVGQTISGMIGSASFMLVFLVLVYVILLVILFFKMLSQGAELFVFRLGVPLAVVGLVSSDGGLFTNYMQMLLKELLTIMVQYGCVILGVKAMLSASISGVVAGLALEIVAFAAPKLLSQVLVPKGSGGAMQKISTVAMAVRTFAAM